MSWASQSLTAVHINIFGETRRLIGAISIENDRSRLYILEANCLFWGTAPTHLSVRDSTAFIHRKMTFMVWTMYSHEDLLANFFMKLRYRIFHSLEKCLLHRHFVISPFSLYPFFGISKSTLWKPKKGTAKTGHLLNKRRVINVENKYQPI